MRFWLRRAVSVTAVLVVCTAVGWLMGSALHAPLAGLLASAMLGLAAMFGVDARRGRRLMRWLREGAGQELDREPGVWGDVAYHLRRELRQRELQLGAEKLRLQQLLAALDASPVGLMLLDEEQRIDWCSRAAADHLGLDPQRDRLQHATNLIRAPEFVEQLQQPAAEAAVVFAGAGGVRVSTLIRPYGGGQRLVLTQDVTERERAETMRRDFVANVSHEIRTPLTVLAGFVETLRDVPLDDDGRTRVLGLMTTQAQRMQALVADLLTLAKLEGSPRPSSERWVPVRALLQRARDDAQRLSADRHDIACSGGDGALVAGSERELLSALGNLAVNAVHYTPAGGRVDIDWQWLPDGRGAFVVRDSGIGVAREHLARLTERFYRVDGDRSRASGGTGLGLAIVKHVALRHGGEIDIDSELDKGSRFRLLLPANRLRREDAVAGRPATAA